MPAIQSIALTPPRTIRTTVAKPDRCGSCGGVIRDTGECRCSD